MTDEQMKTLAKMMANYVLENGMNNECITFQKASEFLGMSIRALKNKIEAYDDRETSDVTKEEEDGDLLYSNYLKGHGSYNVIAVPSELFVVIDKYNNQKEIDGIRLYLLDAFEAFLNTEITGCMNEFNADKIRWALTELKNLFDALNFIR